jgi:hypothetical protein
MLRLWFPKNFEESKKENINDYITECTIAINPLKMILRNNINISRWNLLTTKLINSEIVDVQNSYKFLARRIPLQYIDRLLVAYDTTTSKCYYYVPDMVRCQYTTNSLNDVVRLIEYGNNTIPPMHWLRDSYMQFVDLIMENEK